MSDLGPARAVLKKVFGYDDFRPGQDEVLRHVLAGEDVLAIMPTGSGKSMCYQLPAVLGGGLTLVVSPLIALMRDQVQQMNAAGVAAATLNSTSTPDEADAAWDAIARGELRLLFVSPERLVQTGLTDRLARIGVKRLAIDEAHCVSQWGHDFRPEYQQLAGVRERLGGAQVIALTATADAVTRGDIASSLFPAPPQILVQSFDRPNLDLTFAVKDRPRRQIEDVVARHPGRSGIVYASSRQKTEKLAEFLSEKKVRALPYHAGLDQEVRARNQDVFLQEDGVVMVATVAFGMGINKPDVRFVVHADMPGGVEAYYQEIGRAGRDGLPAETLTLYSMEDMAFRRRQVDSKEIGEERRRAEHRRLSAMVDLCEHATCRRQALLAYFGEQAPRCGRCDLCTGKAELRDATVDAQKVLSAAVRTGERFGAGHLADVLLGEKTETVSRLGHDALKTFGVGRDKSRRAWMTAIRQIFAAGLLTEAGEHGGFAVTDRGVDVLHGREPLALRTVSESELSARRRPARTETRNDLEGADAALFEHLRALRLKLAREQEVAAYVVFPDRTLIDMARHQPRTLEEMKLVDGVGAAKLAHYGELFLAAIAEFNRG